MTKSELVRQLSAVHRETIAMVQKLSKEDFEKKAPAAEWSARDLFAHLAHWNREATGLIGTGSPAGTEKDVLGCHDIPPAAELGLAKVMEAFRSSLEGMIRAYGKAPSARIDPHGADASSATIASIIRHYQKHQNDLKILLSSFRPH
jgi:uncharacterized protein (TIGR03083 family)